MNFYLLYEPNNVLHAFIVASELQFQIFDSMNKIVQNVKFSPVSQISDSTLKLYSTCQHESRGMLGFKNRALDIKLLKFYTNRDNRAYLNLIFNRSSFAKYETTIGFVMSIQVREWSQILIRVLVGPASKTKQSQTVNFTNCLEKCDFL